MSTSVSSNAQLKTYVSLTKPGIIFGNLVTAVGAFVLGAKGNISLVPFLSTMAALALIIGSACVFNNYIDRDMDLKMGRTKHRALATGLISIKNALLFAIALLFTGITLLCVTMKLLPLAVALIGFFVYVVFYSLSKYKTVHATLIGSIAGAVPPVVGYTAATNALDIGAFLIFLILVLWQMPHFYAIAMYRYDDYKAAAIPVLPIVSGFHTAKIQMAMYVVLFTVASALPTYFKLTGNAYLLVAVVLGSLWLVLALMGFKEGNDPAKNKLWGRKMFLFSLIVITVLFTMIAVDPFLPLVK